VTTLLARLRRFSANLTPATTPMAVALAATFVTAPQQAEAWTRQFDGSFTNSETYTTDPLTVTITTGMLTTDTVSVYFQDGDTSDVASHSISVNGGGGCSGAACNGYTFTPPSAGQYTFVVTGQSTGENYVAYLECRGTYDSGIQGYPAGTCANPQTSYSGGGRGGSTGGGSTGGGSTPTQTTASQQAGQVVAATGASSSSASGTAIGNAISSRGGSGGPQVSTQGVFISTQGENSNANFWANLSGTKFSGVLTGGGAELTFGADWEIGAQTILGAALSYGKYDVTIGGTNYDTEALAFGPYISTGIGENLNLDAYVLFARPEYVSGATTWKSNRVMGGLTAGMDYMIGQIQMTGYLGVSGFKEQLPAAAPGGARDVSQAMASIGTRFDFAPTAAVRPSLTVGADAIRFNDGATVTKSVSPRIGFGLDADMGPGTFSVNLNGGEMFKDARAVTLGIKYTASF